MRCALIAAPLFVSVIVGVASAQQSGQQFDVVSIKPNTTGAAASSLRPDANGLIGTNINLLRLVRVAYQVPNFQIVDAPGWFESERFDLQARAEGTVSVTQLQEMIRGMLADRFGLRIRSERRAVSGYELQLERPGHAGLRTSPQPCAVAQSDQPRATGGLPPCIRAIAGHLNARGVPMAMVAQQLQGYVNQSIVDRTALDGFFDFDLRWRPDTAPDPEQVIDPDAPSIFTAVREQLGLRLVPAKVSVDVYAIVDARRPDAN
jgi:uncharacterized protein (TIGR03435 family)